MNENVLICVAVLKPNHFYIVVIKKKCQYVTLSLNDWQQLKYIDFILTHFPSKSYA